MTVRQSNSSIAIIGGDYRQYLLFQNLSKKGFSVKGILLDSKSNELPLASSLINKLQPLPICDIWITGIPFTKDHITLFSKSPKGSITISAFLEHLSLHKPKLLIGGSFPKEVVAFAREHQIPCNDLLKNPALTIENAIPTAEGAIFHAIKESPYTLHGNQALILGFGTCGKALALTLRGLGCKLTVCARKEQDYSLAASYGLDAIDYNTLPNRISDYLFIFNTVPALILTKELLALTNPSCTIIDIASSPGGCDFNAAKELDRTTVFAPGLPGTFSPQTAADLLEHHIIKLL